MNHNDDIERNKQSKNMKNKEKTAMWRNGIAIKKTEKSEERTKKKKKLQTKKKERVGQRTWISH